MVGRCLIYYETEVPHDFLCVPYLNWSHTLEFRSWTADGIILLDSPDLNKIGLWLNEKKKKEKPAYKAGLWLVSGNLDFRRVPST